MGTGTVGRDLRVPIIAHGATDTVALGMVYFGYL